MNLRKLRSWRTANTTPYFLVLINQSKTSHPFYTGYNYSRHSYVYDVFATSTIYEGNNEDPLSLHKYTFGSNDPTNRIDPSGNDDIEGELAEEPDVLWPSSNTTSDPEAFVTMSGFKLEDRLGLAHPNTSMSDLASLAKNALHLHGAYSSFSYLQEGTAEEYIMNQENQNHTGKPLKVVLVGHSLGGSAANALANMLKTVPNVEVSRMYYIDAVGYASTSLIDEHLIPFSKK